MKHDAKPAAYGADPRLQRFSGRHNPRLKELRQAFRRGELTSAGECAIEGVKLVEEAIRAGQRLTGIFFSESALLEEEAIRASERLTGLFFSKSARPLATKLLPQIAAKVEILVLPGSIFNATVPSESPQGVAALVKIHVASAPQLLDRAATGPIVVVAGLQDPGNVGTILRSAEAFGAAGAFFTEGTVSPYNSKVLRGSAGSIFRLPVVQISSAELIPLLRERGARLLATSSHKGIPLPEASWTLPLAIFIGNEGAGLSRDLLHQMDETIVIPQSAQVESLNAGVAASIVLYEAARQRKDL